MNSILNVGGIEALLGGILVIVVLTVAIRSVMHAHRSNIAAVLTAVGIVGLSAMIYGLASGGDLGKLGADVARTVLHL